LSVKRGTRDTGAEPIGTIQVSCLVRCGCNAVSQGDHVNGREGGLECMNYFRNCHVHGQVTAR